MCCVATEGSDSCCDDCCCSCVRCSADAVPCCLGDHIRWTRGCSWRQRCPWKVVPYAGLQPQSPRAVGPDTQSWPPSSIRRAGAREQCALCCTSACCGQGCSELQQYGPVHATASCIIHCRWRGGCDPVAEPGVECGDQGCWWCLTAVFGFRSWTWRRGPCTACCRCGCMRQQCCWRKSVVHRRVEGSPGCGPPPGRQPGVAECCVDAACVPRWMDAPHGCCCCGTYACGALAYFFCWHAGWRDTLPADCVQSLWSERSAHCSAQGQPAAAASFTRCRWWGCAAFGRRSW
mmetsp:Transcript_43776/g.131216  ORF Transcript_43776/g.131216 Transcript_43776/m.131216 type:complete len:290 (-) Transcript_43776:197-1066(-)